MQRLVYNAYRTGAAFSNWYEGLATWAQDAIALAVAVTLIAVVAHVDGQKFY